MSIPKKRTYNAANRHAQAESTKNRILEAGKKLFQSEGFEKVTIEKLAQEAQVSTPTIYSLFQSKRGILFALMDAAIPVDRRGDLVEQAKTETCPKKRIAYGAKIARLIYDAERSQMALFRGAAVLAPEFKELEEERENRRYHLQEESVEDMFKKGGFHPELTLAQVRDILWTLTSRDLYRMLVVERGWTSDAYEQWLSELLVKSLVCD